MGGPPAGLLVWGSRGRQSILSRSCLTRSSWAHQAGGFCEGPGLAPGVLEATQAHPAPACPAFHALRCEPRLGARARPSQPCSCRVAWRASRWQRIGTLLISLSPVCGAGLPEAL